MPVLDDVSAAIVESMRRREPARLSALRMLKAALVNRSVQKGRDLDDTEAWQVVASVVKQRKEAVEQFTKGGRPELAAKEAAEIPVLEAFLPPAVEPAALEEAVTEAIRECGATSSSDIGRVMKAAMARLAGLKVDGRAVNALVRKKLGGS